MQGVCRVQQQAGVLAWRLVWVVGDLAAPSRHPLQQQQQSRGRLHHHQQQQQQV
jgi:hypothetical protein